MVNKYNIIRNSSKKAMTLVALLVTMGVTMILLGMFVPILTQGLVNIANGKSFDGSINLSRRNGYFMCYYNSDGVLTQSRADVAPNGRDVEVITLPAVGDACRFEIPTWPDSFKVTLIGGGGAGATPDFEVFDEEYQAAEDDVCLTEYRLDAASGTSNLVSYQFDNSKEHFCLLSKLFNEAKLCLGVNQAVMLGYQEAADDESVKGYEIKVDRSSGKLDYLIGDEVVTIYSGGKSCKNSTTGANICASDEATVTEVGNSRECGNLQWLLTTSDSRVDLNSIVLTRRQSGIQINIAEGGKSGQKVEQIVPFFEETEGETGVFVIPGENIGDGGRSGVNEGRGGNTFLTVPGGVVLTANGGEAGDFEEQKFYNEGANLIPGRTLAGQNGVLDKFVPQPLRITNLRRSTGSLGVDTPPQAATYPGSGGGGGAIRLEDYMHNVVRSDNECISPRVRLNVFGDNNNYELECTPNLNHLDFHDVDTFRTRTNGADGAPGAILIAW